MAKVFLAVGSNISRRVAFAHAYQALKKIMMIESSSSIYSSIPRGKAKGPRFFNSVLFGTTELSLDEFRPKLKDIEASLGRSRWSNDQGESFNLRCLDIDLLMYDQVVSEEPELPRSDIYKYDFVLRPLAEIAPEVVPPGDKACFAEIALNSALPLDALDAVPFLGEELLVPVAPAQQKK